MACIRERRGRLVIDYYDQHGKRRWETQAEGTTKKQARDRMREIEQKVEKGSYIPPKERKKKLRTQLLPGVLTGISKKLKMQSAP